MDSGYFSEDIVEFIKLLSKYNVKYVIVGGEAVIYYGYPRLTGDVDFFYSIDSENVKSLFNALHEFWSGDIPGIDDPDELTAPGYVIQFGRPPNRIDIMNSIEGISFEEAWRGKTSEFIKADRENVPIYYLGLNHLIKNKRETGRQKDLDDLDYLSKLK